MLIYTETHIKYWSQAFSLSAKSVIQGACNEYLIGKHVLLH